MSTRRKRAMKNKVKIMDVQQIRQLDLQRQKDRDQVSVQLETAQTLQKEELNFKKHCRLSTYAVDEYDELHDILSLIDIDITKFPYNQLPCVL